jgi:hypothetical protein
MRKHIAETNPLASYDEIAARIRAIATQAAEEYRRRREPVPDYVQDAMQTGLGPRKSRLPKAKQQVKPPLQPVNSY